MRRMLAVTVALTLSTAAAFAAERVYKPHSRVNDPQRVSQLQQQMHLLENGFAQILDRSSDANYDSDAILKAVSQMEGTARAIHRIIPDKEWDEPIHDLNARLAQVRKYANRQDPMTLQKRIDELDNACFRCHAVNAPQK